MARIIVHTKKEPYEFITASGETVKICRCGLTKNDDGTCDQTHLQIDEEEGKIYSYDEKTMKKQEVELALDEDEEDEMGHSCACGHGGCGCHGHDEDHHHSHDHSHDKGKDAE